MKNKIIDRKQVDLGMFGAIAECRHVEAWSSFKADAPTSTYWVAAIDTGMNRCEGKGDTPEQAARDAMVGQIISLKASLAELQLFMQAKSWEMSL